MSKMSGEQTSQTLNSINTATTNQAGSQIINHNLINAAHPPINNLYAPKNSSSSLPTSLINNLPPYTNVSVLAHFISRLNLCALPGQHAHPSSSLYELVVANKTNEFDSFEWDGEHQPAESRVLGSRPDETGSPAASVLFAQTKASLKESKFVTNKANSGVEQLISKSSFKKHSSAERVGYSADSSIVEKSSSLHQASSFDHKQSFDYDSSDDDSDDSDYGEHDHDEHKSKAKLVVKSYANKKQKDNHKKKHHHGHSGKGKKKAKKSRGKKRKKVVYSVSAKMAPKKKSHQHQHAKLLKGKVYYPQKNNHKKVTYAYVYEEPDDGKHYASKYNYHEHGDHKMHGQHYKQPYHEQHHAKHGAGKGRISVAGLFGYTLLCVNYLMMLKEPQHEKYYGGKQHDHHDDHHDHHHAAAGSHYPSHWSDKDAGRGYASHHKKGGPILLAHCREMERLTGDRWPRQQQVSFRKRRDLDQIIESVEAAQQAIENRQQNQEVDRTITAKNETGADNKLIKQSSDRLLSPALQNYLGQVVLQQQSNQQNPEEGQAEVFVLSGGGGSGSAIGGSINSIGNGVDGDSGAVIVETNGRVGVGANRAGAARLLAGNTLNNRANPALQLLLQSGLDPNAPELIGRRDNLIRARSQEVDVSLRVTGRSRFAMAPLMNDGVTDQAGLGPVGVLAIGRGTVVGAAGLLQAIEPAVNTVGGGLASARLRNSNIEVEGMVADQPADPGTNQEQGGGGGGGLVLDLPEFVLSGDSIVLTCNHRMPLNRIYSVKWFKDSLEFYRFIPANGPARAKSFLPLAELRLDMARSNSESLSLRNVSHLSSGLYRCEVVSEGPNFETRVGEKRMQVYSLPNTGPQLTLLDRAELLMPALPNQSPMNDDGEPLVGVGIEAGSRTSLPLTTTAFSNNDNNAPRLTSALMNGDNNLNLLELHQRQLQNLNQPQQFSNNMRPQLVIGPLVRCQSTRSYPAAQLRLTINGLELSPSRLIENSTLTYSDFTEANLITFRLALSDFIQTPLDRAASLKTSPQAPATNNSKARNSTWPAMPPNDSAVIRAPENIRTPATSDRLATPAPRTQPIAQKQGYANALVQFNDRNVGMTKEDFKANREAKSQPQKSHQNQISNSSNANLKRTGNQPPDNNGKSKADRVTSSPQRQAKPVARKQPTPNGRPFAPGPQAAAANPSPHFGEQTADSASESSSSGSADKQTLAGHQEQSGESTIATTDTNEGEGRENLIQPSANYRQALMSHNSHDHHRTSDKQETGPKLQLEPTTSDNENKKKLIRSRRDNGEPRDATVIDSNLSGQEQRIRSTIGSSSNGLQEQQRQSNGQQQPPPISYSNYIRIKCTSLVSQVRYEMISELSVPLSVLAGQAIAASQNQQRDQATGIQLNQFGFDASSNRNRFGMANNNNGFQSRPGSVILSGTDRVAQASQFQAPTHRAPGVAFASAQGLGGQIISSPQMSWRNSSSSTSLSPIVTPPVNVTTNYNGNIIGAAPSAKAAGASRGFHITGSSGKLHQPTSATNWPTSAGSFRSGNQMKSGSSNPAHDSVQWSMLVASLLIGSLIVQTESLSPTASGRRQELSEFRL